MKRALLVLALVASPLLAADLEHPYERSPWARTGSENGAKRALSLPRGAGAAPLPRASGEGRGGGASPIFSKTPGGYEHSQGFAAERAPRRAIK